MRERIPFLSWDGVLQIKVRKWNNFQVSFVPICLSLLLRAFEILYALLVIALL